MKSLKRIAVILSAIMVPVIVLQMFISPSNQTIEWVNNIAFLIAGSGILIKQIESLPRWADRLITVVGLVSLIVATVTVTVTLLLFGYLL